MTKTDGVELNGLLSPWIRFAIGLAIILLSAAPFVLAVRWW